MDLRPVQREHAGKSNAKKKTKKSAPAFATCPSSEQFLLIAMYRLVSGSSLVHQSRLFTLSESADVTYDIDVTDEYRHNLEHCLLVFILCFTFTLCFIIN